MTFPEPSYNSSVNSSRGDSSSSGRSIGHVLILGGSGFIGTRFATFLADRGVPFRIGDLNESTAFPRHWDKCDVTNLDSLRPLVTGASAIVNLAAEHRDDVTPVSRYTEVNVHGASVVCDAARAAGVDKILFTSSAAVYGFQPLAVDEDGPFEPFNEYGKTKLKAEAIYRAWADENAFRSLVIVRPTVVCGEGNRGNVYNLLRQIAAGKFLMVGSGRNFKSMAYVGNVAAFLHHCVQLDAGTHIFNYVDGPDMSTRDLVEQIHRYLSKPNPRRIPQGLAMATARALDVAASITGRKFPISAVRVRKFCETTQFKADRIRRCGFTPPFSLSEGLRRTVAFEFPDRTK